MAVDPLDTFVEDFVEAIHDQNAAIFAGAGLSIPAGMVDWRGLLRKVAKEVGLDVDQETDLVAVAQYHLNEHRSRHRIHQEIVTGFASKASSTKNHEILASLPIRTYWTTNYDTLIETSLRAAGKTPDVKTSVENLAINVPRRDAVVFKMHGDVASPDTAVVTKDDYETYSQTRQLFSTALQGDLVEKTFLFLGFSFSDPNLDHILGRIRVLLGQNVRTHYCLLRRVQRSEFKSTKEFNYAQAKQDLQVRDLKRYGIYGLLLDSYSAYTQLLERVRNRFKRSRVFISGSAADYAPWSPNEAQKLVRELTAKLVANHFTVVSGFGIGVGDHVINGAMSALEKEQTRVVDERLVLRPFPQHIADTTQRKQAWTEYRNALLDEAGVAIFLFGNKNVAGSVVSADGVREEFDLAVKRKMPVVPVGCTGSVAGEVHAEVLAKITSHFPTMSYKKLLAGLGKKRSATVLAAQVLTILQKLRDDAD